MIKEAYCSFEVYKLLKEKRFDGEIHTTFDKEGYTQPSITHQMAMAWLREKFHLHIDANIFQDFSNDFDGNVVDEWFYWSWNVYSTLSGKTIAEAPFGNDTFDSYEEAVEASLKFCLENLI